MGTSQALQGGIAAMGISGVRWVCMSRGLQGFSGLLAVSMELKILRSVVDRGHGVIFEALSWARAIMGSLGL